MLSTVNSEMLPKKKLMSLTSTATIHVYLNEWIGIDVDLCLLSLDSLHTDDCRGNSQSIYVNLFFLR